MQHPTVHHRPSLCEWFSWVLLTLSVVVVFPAFFRHLGGGHATKIKKRVMALIGLKRVRGEHEESPYYKHVQAGTNINGVH